MLGTQFTRLTVIAEAPRAHRKRRWHCSCACGGSTIAFQWSLLAGRSRSCGCLKGEELNARQGHETHGFRGSPEYRAWVVMKKRCYNVKHRDYRSYGGAGVIVCEPWRNSFLAFYRDVGPDRPRLTGSAESGKTRASVPRTAGGSSAAPGATTKNRLGWNFLKTGVQITGSRPE
jgi:hypothetical protein